MPKVIALRSMAKLPARARFERTKRSPSAIAGRMRAGGPEARGGWGESASAASSMATQLPASTA